MTTHTSGLRTHARWRLPIAAASILALSAVACAKRDVVVEIAPATEKFARARSCAVSFSSDAGGQDASEASTFVPWFEERLREVRFCDPVVAPSGQAVGAAPELTLRLEATRDTEQIDLRVEISDPRTSASYGELEAFGAMPRTQGDGAALPRRQTALRSAADQVIDLLREQRRASASQGRPAPARATQATLRLGDAPFAGGVVCATECRPPSSSISTHAELHRVAGAMDPTMKALRECLDRVGAQLIVPAVLLRFAPDGELQHVRIDVGGYEQLGCIQEIRTRPPRGVSTTRASELRCEYHCFAS